ncbi:MAG: DnaJ domain-containing protein [Magnetococcales bacterium]|nr:DnaJ domain-containing protein [Magnetococcales bacterium]
MNFSIPWRNQTTESVRNQDEAALPPGMRRVETRCKGCGKGLAIRYPEAATRWKVACTACSQPIQIELVGGRKCLVFQIQGRRIVERIGLTDQRRRFFRARCYSCDEPLVVSEAEIGRLRGCHRCGLEYLVREEGELYYETAVRINDESTTYREKVQESSGYVVHKNSAFFLEEERPVSGRRPERVAILERGLRVGEGGEVRLAGTQGELTAVAQERDRLRAERDLLKNRLQGHDEAMRTLDEAMTRRAQLESRVGELEGALQRAEEAREGLRGERERLRVALQGSEAQVVRMGEALRQAQEERKGWEVRLLAGREAVVRLEERLARLDPVGSGAAVRVRELEAENGRLLARIAEVEQALEQARASAAESASEPAWRRISLTEEGSGSGEGEDWYCEEGSDSGIAADNEIGRARRLLGIQGQPTAARIKSAFRRRVKRYHPDMVSALGLELRELAHRKMQEINRAYGLLMKEYGHG